MTNNNAEPVGASEKDHRALSDDSISTTNESTSSDLDEIDVEEDASRTNSSVGDIGDEDDKRAEGAQDQRSQLNDDYNHEWTDDYNPEARLQQYLEDSGQLIDLLAKVFQHLCRSDQGVQLTPFHSCRIPPVSLIDYITRIRKYMQCSDACLVLALVFIDRLVKVRPGFEVCKANVHRLVATSIVLAAKCHDDVFYSNAYYAKVVGMKTAELNKLESLLLQLVGWRVHVDAEEFERYLHMLSSSDV